MTEISASLVKELRDMTGLAMMECKKALTEAGGDIKKAEELLRIKSGAKASKAASRIAAEGVIGTYVSPDGKIGALVELNCETDFVAKNDDFLSFAQQIAETAAKQNPRDISQLTAGKIEERRQQLVQKIGENISIRRFRRLQAAGKLALYVHGAKIGVLVDYEGPEEVGKDLGMHIAFSKPRHLSKADVPLEVVNEERKIQEARAKESGKPPEIAAKMVEGSLNKFLAEISLMGQPFVKDDKQTVEKMLASKKAKMNGYAFLVVGEGIAKEKDLH
jgi:elongation factor Ts